MILGETNVHANNRMQPDFGKLRLPQPLMRSVEMSIVCRLLPPALVY